MQVLCADLGDVGTMLFVSRLPGSTLSSTVTAAVKEVGSVVTWRSVQNTVESPEFCCLPEDSDACIGSVVTWVHESFMRTMMGARFRRHVG